MATSFLHLETFTSVLDVLLGLGSRKGDETHDVLGLETGGRAKGDAGDAGSRLGEHDVEGAVYDLEIATRSFKGNQACLVLERGECCHLESM